MEMLPWVIGVVLAGFLLMVGIELILIRLGIQPADPAQKAGGVRDIARKVNTWLESRRPSE